MLFYTNSTVYPFLCYKYPNAISLKQLISFAYSTKEPTLSVYRSRFEALPSIGSAIFAEHTVKRSNNATDNGHIYACGFADDCYGLGCDL